MTTTLLIICGIGFVLCSGLATLCGKVLTETFTAAGKDMWEEVKPKLKK